MPPLALPATQPLPTLARLSQYEAVRLFIDRATAVRADFAVTNANAPAVAEICVRLDGLPLAIELVAARVKLLPPEALLTRLDQRLKLLTGGARDLPARQQTLRAAIAWSYDLLDPGEQQLLRRMAVFQGGRTLEALEAVCNADGALAVDVLDGVTALVDHSLLLQRTGADGAPRLWMLETIHEYAREQLAASGEERALRDAHLAFFAALGEQADTETLGPAQAEWLERLTDEIDNLRGALAWAATRASADPGPADLGLRLAAGLVGYWQMRGPVTEGLAHVERALSFNSGRTPARAAALFAAAALTYRHGDPSRAAAWAESARDLHHALGDRRGAARTLIVLGASAAEQGDYARARTWAGEVVAFGRGENDPYFLGHGLSQLGILLAFEGDYQAAQLFIEDAIAEWRRAGSAGNVANELANLGVIEQLRGNYAPARRHLREAFAYAGRFVVPRQAVWALSGLGGLVIRQGVAGGALGAVAVGTRVLAAVTQALRDLGVVLETLDRLAYEQNLALARDALGAHAFAREWAAGQALSLDEAIALALEATEEEADA